MRRAAVFAAWWAVLTGLWLLFASTVTWPEVVVAIGAGAMAAAVAVLALRVTGLDVGFDRHWATWLISVPVDVVSDTLTIAALVARRLRGEPVGGQFRRVPLPEQPDAAHIAGRNTLVTVLVSMSPGTVVVRADPDGNEMLVHTLAAPGRTLRRVSEQ